MSLFHNILSGLQKRFDDEQGKNKEIAQIITETIGITISEQQISVKRGIVHITTPATVKLAILVKKESIIAACKAKRIAISAIR